MVASLLYYWVPDTRCALRDAEKLPPGSWLRIRPDGGGPPRHLLVAARGRRAGRARAVPRSRRDRRGLDAAQPHGRRAGGHVPVRRAGLELPHGARGAPPAGHLGVHDRVPGRGRQVRGHARRPGLRPPSWRRKYGVRLNEIEIAPDVLDLLPLMTHHLDEPIGDPAAINSYLICKAAREAGVKVLLSGMGADELFGGYRKHAANLIARATRRSPHPCGVLSTRPSTASRRLGQPRLPVGAVREALPVLRRPPRGDGLPAQLHDVRPRRAARAGQPGPRAGRRRRAGRARRDLPRPAR